MSLNSEVNVSASTKCADPRKTEGKSECGQVNLSAGHPAMQLPWPSSKKWPSTAACWANVLVILFFSDQQNCWIHQSWACKRVKAVWRKRFWLWGSLVRHHRFWRWTYASQANTLRLLVSTCLSTTPYRVMQYCDGAIYWLIIWI